MQKKKENYKNSTGTFLSVKKESEALQEKKDRQ
jgi:hypothetical protein